MHDKLGNGWSYKMLPILDEYTRQALAVAVRTWMSADDDGWLVTCLYGGWQMPDCHTF